MCRICGIYNPEEKNLNERIRLMRDSMLHGGPDDAGLFVDQHFPLALGHRRLSLIDLSSNGHQPMHDEENGLSIVFNGEIYNYQELKNTLIQYGYKFQTNTDTEVILKAYSRWGKSCFELLNGMFAIVIWDQKKSCIILARDHAGMKPLYYAKVGQSFSFASEVRAFSYAGIHFEESHKWPVVFLAFGHLPEPITTLKDLFSLEKGTVMTVELPSLTISKFTFFKWKLSGVLKNEDEALLLLRDTLTAAVNRHMISDAPLGIFLSGGIDSSLLTILASQSKKSDLKTLSITFKEKAFSEEKYQRIVVDKLQTNHASFQVNRSAFNEALPDALLAMDQPSIDGINTYFISKYARTRGLKAVISGVGADELFGGYPSFFHYKELQAVTQLPNMLLELLHFYPDQRVRKLSYAGMHNTAGEYLLMRSLFDAQSIADILGISKQEVESILTEISSYYRCEAEKADRISWFETNYYMQNQLLKDADCMGMWHGLEIRMPFLDKELMMLAGTLHQSIKFHPKQIKYLLVKAFTNLLPEEIWNRKKQGFTFPFEGWLKENEYTKPTSPEEDILYKSFQKNHINWSRYWCALMMNRYTGLRKDVAA